MAGFKRGARLKKVGLHAQDTSELFFDNVIVPKTNLLGAPKQGFSATCHNFWAGERLIAAVDGVALAQTAFDLTLDLQSASAALSDNRSVRFQNSRFTMAALPRKLTPCRTFIDQCVLEYNANRLTGDLAAEAKLLGTELAGKVADACVQLHGGAGYMEEYRIARLFCDAPRDADFCGNLRDHERDHRARTRPGRSQAETLSALGCARNAQVSPKKHPRCLTDRQARVGAGF